MIGATKCINMRNPKGMSDLGTGRGTSDLGTGKGRPRHTAARQQSTQSGLPVAEVKHTLHMEYKPAERRGRGGR